MFPRKILGLGIDPYYVYCENFKELLLSIFYRILSGKGERCWTFKKATLPICFCKFPISYIPTKG